VSDPLGEHIDKKVSIIGCGQVGLAIAYSILNQGTANMIALVDMAGTKLEGECKDLRQGAAFTKRVKIEASTDYDITRESNLVIITAGAAQRPGESRLNLVGRNVKIMKSIISKVLTESPNATICIVANPCDIMTAVAAKLAGPNIPPGRIFGSGCTLDSGRFTALIAHSLNVNTNAVQGYIIGEHGDSSVPVWSSVRVGGVPAVPPGEDIPEVYKALHAEVFQSAGDVIVKKGYTNWAVGLACARIAEVVLGDQRTVLPVSTCVRGMYGVEEDVYVSVPCIVGSQGVIRVVDLPLTAKEKEGLLGSVKSVWDVQSGIWDEVA
jgi:L-lactate dehydrogenase